MKTLILLLCLSVIISGCKSKFERNDPLGKKNYPLLSQDSSKVNFPGDFSGKPFLLGFIFTNCPDVCPMTSHNFQLVQEEVRDKGINNVNFVLISFDPDRDKPWILKDYGHLRDINLSNFKFLTGEKDTIHSLMRKLQVIAIPGDSSKTSDGDLIYFFTHSDRAFLIDKNNKIRSEYRASKMNISEVINDLKELE
jgi:protein SCO1/2